MVFRVQVAFESTLPLQRGDSFSNTFHFTEDSPSGTFGDLMDAVRDFYNEDHGTLDLSVGSFMSDKVSRAGGSAIIDVYDLDDPIPRVPVASMAFTLAAAGTTDSLPGEVAAVLSHRAAMVPGVNRQRLRGRTYIGPLSRQATQASTALLVPGLTSAMGESAIAHLRDGAAGWVWVVYSDNARDNSNQEIPYEDRPFLPPIASPVTHVEVDNAADTQRRRGRAATERDEFGV